MHSIESIKRAARGALSKIGNHPDNLTMVLQEVQRNLGHVPPEALKEIAASMNVPLSRAYSVARFYKSLSLSPRGKCSIRVCTGTACHVRGAGILLENLRNLLDIKSEGASKDSKFHLEEVGCVGACAMAPVVVVDGKVHGPVGPADLKNLLGIKSKRKK